MKKFQLLMLLFGLMFFGSCAKQIYVNYQTESVNTGEIVLKPTKKTSRTYVTINDNLIVDKKNVKSVTIRNVPEGKYDINYTSDNSWYKDKLDFKDSVKVEKGSKKAKLIEVPPYSTGYWIYQGVVYAVLMTVLFAPIY